jgi:TonB-dependent starch-binding outer membrane protein SusC
LNLAPRYKNFYIDLFFYSALGQDIFNTTRWVTDFAQNGTYNRRTEILNAWTESNTGATIPALTLDDKGNDEGRGSTYYLENGSFLKLRTARLGYNVPSSLLKGWRINIYGEVQNALTFTKYSGVDPEVPQVGGNAIGIDAGVYPLPRTFLVGVNFQL